MENLITIEEFVELTEGKFAQNMNTRLAAGAASSEDSLRFHFFDYFLKLNVNCWNPM